MRSNLTVSVRTVSCSAAIGFLLVFAQAQAQAQVLITFDDIPSGEIGTQYLNQGVMFFVGNGAQGNSVITNTSASVGSFGTSVSQSNVLVPSPGTNNDIYVQFFSSPGQRAFAQSIGITNDTQGDPPAILQAFGFDGILLGQTGPLGAGQSGTLSFANIYTARIIGQPGAGGLLGVDNFRFTPSVVVPEANTFALALPALGMIALCNRVGAVVIRRRKK